jgi:tripartite-type tricarboxylate transporter receptor subunit TctC
MRDNRWIRRLREEKMQITRRHAIAGALGAMIAPQARANDWPDKPVFWICPFAPGGGADTISRVVGAELSSRFGQRVIVDNKAGGSGLIGTRLIASAPPDGHTVGLLTDVHCVNLALGQDLGYDADKDFTYISQLIRVPMGMFTSAKKPELKTLAGLIAYAKANPGKLTAASIGPATPHHLAVEWLKAIADIDVLIVNFRGIPQGIQALVSGDADLMVMGVGVAADGYIAQGLIYQVGVATQERMANMPNVPTFIEQGIPDFELVSWYGLVGPAGFPQSVLTRWHSDLVASLESPDVRRRIEATGAGIAPSSPTDYAAWVRKESDKFKKIVAMTNGNTKTR